MALFKEQVVKILRGNFKDGFTGGFSGSLVGDYTPKTNNRITDTIITATAGGVAAELGGGKFTNGARSATFVNLFNHLNITEQCVAQCHDNNISSQHGHLTSNERMLLGAPAYAVGGGAYVAGAKGLVSLGRYVPTVFDKIRTWWYSGVASGLTVMSNPAVQIRAADFVAGYSISGAPPPSPLGYAGSGVNIINSYMDNK
ncbi:hypothetical protein [Abyssogena phaseoliformis symbiont]|uniref:hypothetical protein n=1 Tax=Abyssogena phaseoliformis symbiont TaxID=596095 RepID=UPI00191598E2|nr:hypothetical protein [Abyssogena phaseoliformis symbiont]